LETLSVYAANRKGEINQIPFQIDERFPQGSYIFIPNKLAGTGKLSKQDDLIFMARDTGSRIRPQDLPFNNRLIQEIEILDEKSKQKAWVYLVSSPIPSMKIPFSYVQFNAAENNIMGKSYFLSFALSMESPLKQLWQPNHQSISWSEEGKEGITGNVYSLTANIFRESKMEVEVGILGNFVEWKMSPEEFDPREVGHLIGPIRAVRKIRLRPKLALGLNLEPVTVLQIFYDHFMSTSIEGEINGTLLASLSKLKVKFLEDFSQIKDLPIDVEWKGIHAEEYPQYVQLTAKPNEKMQATTLWVDMLLRKFI